MDQLAATYNFNPSFIETYGAGDDSSSDSDAEATRVAAAAEHVHYRRAVAQRLNLILVQTHDYY